MSDKDDHSGKVALVVSVAVTALIMAVGFAWGHFRSPDGAHDAWLAGDTLVVEEYRSGEDGDDERLVVHDLKTGKRLAEKNPGDLTALLVVGDRLWLHGRREYGLEAWSLKDLSVQVTAKELHGVKPADANVCTDGRVARLSLTDGHYGVVDLQTGTVLPEREVGCSGVARRGPLESYAGSSLGQLATVREGSNQRQQVSVAEARYAGGESFLEPQFVVADVGGAVTVDGDVFVVHRVKLGEDRRLQLSRVSRDAVKWTVPLGSSTSLRRALFAAPGTLVVVGYEGVTTLDAATGKVLWRTGS